MKKDITYRQKNALKAQAALKKKYEDPEFSERNRESLKKAGRISADKRRNQAKEIEDLKKELAELKSEKELGVQ